MLDWAKNWYWLAGSVVALGAAGYAIRRRRQSALGGALPCGTPLLRQIKAGPKGEIAAYVSPTGRCPTCDFLDETPKPIRKRIEREFDYAVTKGPTYWSFHFRPLTRQAAPLWKVKVFDHRLYGVPETRGDWVRFVLLRGWIKDKAGKGVEEANNISAAQNTFKEYVARQRACIGLARN